MNSAGENGYPYAEKGEIGISSVTSHKKSTKWIKHLKVRPESVNSWRKNWGKALCYWS